MFCRSISLLLVCFGVASLRAQSPATPAPPGPDTPATPAIANDPVLRRAQVEVDSVRGLVESGVLPRVRLDEAKAHLADMQDDALIRNSLYNKDITVDQADAMVELTARRVARRQQFVEKRYRFLAQGIISQSEMGDSVSLLDQAKREHAWAETRARMARELVDLANNEQEIMHRLEASSAAASNPGGGLVQHFVGTNRFNLAQFPAIDRAFELRFAHPLPVSAMGETAVHRALGFDHRNRVDVALQPDQPEGLWLRGYLTAHHIPFFAFRSAVAHKATGAHIHIGPPSSHYVTQLRPRTAAGGE